MTNEKWKMTLSTLLTDCPAAFLPDKNVTQMPLSVGFLTQQKYSGHSSLSRISR